MNEMIPFEYYIEWIVWLVIWTCVLIASWMQHWVIPDELKLTQFSYIYESSSRKTSFYATIIKVVAIILSMPDFELNSDPNRIGLLTCNMFTQIITFWAIYLTMDKFSQQQYWKSFTEYGKDRRSNKILR